MNSLVCVRCLTCFHEPAIADPCPGCVVETVDLLDRDGNPVEKDPAVAHLLEPYG